MDMGLKSKFSNAIICVLIFTVSMLSTHESIGQIIPNNPLLGQELVDSVTMGNTFATLCTHRAEVGDEVIFNSSVSCGPNIQIQQFLGYDEIVPGVLYVPNGPLVVDSPDPTISYTFTTEGVYLMGCNGKSSENCIVVTMPAPLDPPVGIPTMGEWGLISLMLLLLIFAFASIRQPIAVVLRS